MITVERAPLRANTLSQDEKIALAAMYEDDRVRFCREILPDIFFKPMPWAHRGMLAILTKRADFLLNFGEEQWRDGRFHWTKKQLSKIVRHFVYKLNPKNPASPTLPIFEVEYDKSGRTPVAIHMTLGRFTNMILPRGFSKTTLTNAAVLSMILFKETRYFVYASDTLPHAIDQLDNIKRELLTNMRIHAIWGNIVPGRQDEQTWRQESIETTTGVLGAAKGRGTQIRGMVRYNIRPDLWVLDDIDDEESVSTPDQLRKSENWLLKTVIPAMPRITGEGRLFVLGTVLHPDCIVMKNHRDAQFTSVLFGAIDPDGDMLWDHYMTRETYDTDRKSYQDRGKLYEFGMEYESKIDSDAKLKFKPEYYQKYRWYEPEEFVASFPFRGLAVDPAISGNPNADYCAFAVVGMSERGFFHVAEVFLKQGLTPREQVDKYFELSKKYQCNRHAVEAVAYQRALVHLLQEDMMRQRWWFEINTKLSSAQEGNKILRVEGILQPRYASGVITTNGRFPLLEEQYEAWPLGKKDGPDAIAMAVATLDPFAGNALDGGAENYSNEETEPDVAPEDFQWAR